MGCRDARMGGEDAGRRIPGWPAGFGSLRDRSRRAWTCRSRGHRREALVGDVLGLGGVEGRCLIEEPGEEIALGRSARGREVRRFVGEVEVEEDGGDDGRIGEEREDPHLTATGGTEQRQHVVDASEQDGPADLRGRGRSGGGLDGVLGTTLRANSTTRDRSAGRSFENSRSKRRWGRERGAAVKATGPAQEGLSTAARRPAG